MRFSDDTNLRCIAACHIHRLRIYAPILHEPAYSAGQKAVKRANAAAAMSHSPLFSRNTHKMLRTRVVMRQAALLHHTARPLIAFIISAPHRRYAQIDKTSLQQALHRLGYQSLPPVWRSYPIANLGLIGLHGRTVHTIGPHYACTPHRLSRSFQHYRISLWRGKDGADDLEAMLHRRMRRPPGHGAYGRISGIFI